MPEFAKLLLQILPYLPGIVRFAENIHGAGNGPTKLDTAVNVLQAVVPAVVDHLKNEPANLPKLQSLFGTVVAGLNAAKTWQTGLDVAAAAPSAV